MDHVIMAGEPIDQVADVWRVLWQRTQPRPPMLEFTWIQNWWRLHHNEGQPLIILVVDDERRPIGLAPLYRRTQPLLSGQWLRTVHFLGTGERERDEVLGEYNTWLGAPATMSLVTRQVAVALARCSDLWDRARLERLRGDAGIHEQLPACLGEAAHLWETSATPTFRSPVMPLDDYIAALPSANFRHRCRRALKATRAMGLELVRAETAAQRELLCAALRRLHQQRWSARGEPGAFASPVFTEFHQTMLEADGGADHHWLVGLQGGDGELMAVRYCLRAGDHLYDYVSGVDTTAPTALAPGLSLHLLTIEACVDAGVRVYDLMGGNYQYKHHLALEHDEMRTIDIFSRNARARLWLAARDLRRQLVPRRPAAEIHAPAAP